MALAFSPASEQRIAHLITRYPDSQAACLPVLHLAQDEFGYLSDDAIKLVAARLDLPESHVFGVVTFYTMFHRHPAGKKAIWVCTNISCMLMGGYDVLHKLESKLGIQAGETTADGIHLAEEECLAACADAPMAICGPKYFLRIDSDAKIDQLVADVRAMPAGTTIKTTQAHGVAQATAAAPRPATTTASPAPSGNERVGAKTIIGVMSAPKAPPKSPPDKPDDGK